MKTRRGFVLGMFPLVLVGLAACVGCNSKKIPSPEPTKLTATTLAPAPPSTLDIEVKATLPVSASIDRFSHDASKPKLPGDLISFEAEATVPEGSNLLVEVAGTGVSLKLTSTDSKNRFVGSVAIPDVQAGRYSVQAKLLAGDKVLASRDAEQTLEVVSPVSQCDALQKKLDDLRPTFDFEEHSLNPDARGVLASIVDLFRGAKVRPEGLLIEGHCDERGTNEINMSLGELRAFSARDFLVEAGVVDRSRIETISYGEESPREKGHDEAAWGQNRRIEIKVSCARSRRG